MAEKDKKFIEVECDLPGHEDEKVVYLRKGWKFKHVRLWQDAIINSALTITELAELISEKIESWTLTAELTNDEGETEVGVVPFAPGPECLDEFDQDLANWVILSFRTAYTEAGLPDPNAPSPPSTQDSKTA